MNPAALIAGVAWATALVATAQPAISAPAAAPAPPDLAAQLAAWRAESFASNYARADKLYQLVDAADPAQLRAETAAAAQRLLREDQWDHEEVSALLDAWSWHDGATAHAWVAESAPESRRGMLLRAQLLAWSAVDPAAALAAAREPHALPQTTGSLPDIFDNYFRRDPAAALAALGRLPASPGTADLHAQAFERWAGWDGPAAAAAALRLPENRFRAHAFDAAIRTWATRATPAALAWTQALGDATQRESALRIVVPQLAQSDPAAAVAVWTTLPAGLTKDYRILPLARAWAVRAPAAASAWLQSVCTGAALDYALVTTFEWLTSDHPRAARHFYDALPDRSLVRPNQIRALAITLGREDIAEALAWAQSLPSPGNRNDPRREAVSSLLGSWALADRPRALAVAAAHGYTTPVVVELSRVDLPAAAAWLATQPYRRDDDYAWSNLLDALAAADPPAAAALLAQIETRGGMTAESLAVLQAIVGARRHAGWNDAHRQLELLGRQGRMLDDSAFSLGARFATDPFTTYQWMSTLPPGALRDAAIRSLVHFLRGEDPATALSWAATVSDDTQRHTAMRLVFLSWVERDPDAALAALDKANLDAELRHELRGRLEQRRQELLTRPAPRSFTVTPY